MTFFRRIFRPFALALAAVSSIAGGASLRTIGTDGPRVSRSSQDQQDRAPASAATAASNQSIGIIDAPDFRTWRQSVPIWVGRPRSPHGRQYGPRV